jgi:hypothetical protein
MLDFELCGAFGINAGCRPRSSINDISTGMFFDPKLLTRFEPVTQ